MRHATIWSAILVLFVAANAPLTSGQQADQTLIAIDADGSLRFNNAPSKKVPASEVWRYGRDKASLRGAYLLLRDGSRLAAPSLVTEGEELVFPADEFHPSLWDGLRIPRKEVRGVFWRLPHGEAALAELLKASSPVAADTMKLENGDEAVGTFRGIVFNEATQSDEMIFAVRDVESRIAVARVASLRLAEGAAKESSSPNGAWTLAFSDGSRVLAKKIAADKKSVALELTNGTSLALDAELFWKTLILVEPPRREAIFLDELTEQSYRHLPLFGEPAPWERNRSAAGEPLRAGGAYYAHGVGMWGASRISFAVPKNAKTFAAEIALDDRASALGSVIFRVLGQFPAQSSSPAGGELQLKDLYRGEIMRGGDEPRRISVSVAGATSLILLVDSADQGDGLDLANWIDARFVMGE